MVCSNVLEHGDSRQHPGAISRQQWAMEDTINLYYF